MLSPIKRIRLEQGRLQFQVAAAAGIHAARLSVIETGRAQPKPEEVARIAIALGVAVDALQQPADVAA